jgi:hypothetical protein
MPENNNHLNKRLRMAGVLVLLGLVVELVTFLWNRPVAFFLFIAGAGVTFLGVLIYLFSIVSPGKPPAKADAADVVRA